MVRIFFECFGILAFVAVAYDATIRRCPTAVCRSVGVSAIFSFGILISMAYPILLMDGLIFDLRHVLLVLVASYGGLPATIATTSFALALRIWFGGPGVEAGVAGILLSSSVGYLLACLWPAPRLTFHHLLVMGAGASASLASLLLLPAQVTWTDIWHIIPIMGVAHLVAVPLAGYLLERQRRRVLREDALHQRAGTDALTLLPNRRSLERQGGSLLDETMRRNAACSFLMIDIDHYKSVNDTFGHAAGDEVLRCVAALIREQTRARDLVARYGGEEIAVVMPFAGPKTAAATAERIRKKIEETTFDMRGFPVRITVSIGTATTSSERLTLAQALGRADEALYRAKREGRNRTEMALAA